jgi:hypothetical protein
MAYSFGRQFRRIAAEALTADRDEMDALIARILPPREDGGARVPCLETEKDYKAAPAVIVAAFFAYAITGDERADLLRKTEDPAFRKPALDESNDYALYGPISLTPGWRNPAGLPPSCASRGMDFPPWGPPISFGDATGTPRRSAANGAREVVNNNENTSAACCDAVDSVPERPP